MSIVAKSKINQLLSKGIQGGLYFSDYLKGKGYSSQLLERYRHSGWLTALTKGVMYRNGEKLSAVRSVAAYYAQMCRSCRIAAHSALEIFGYNHYVPMGKPTLFVTGAGTNTPKWMKMDVYDRVIKTFSTETFRKTEQTEQTVEGVTVLVSVPEQAFLECLLLAESHYSYMDLYYIMEQLTTLRPKVVQELLENTKSLRVKRMFLYMAEKAGHYWTSQLDTSRIKLGTSKLQLVRNGVYVPEFKITVPKELNDYE